MGDILKTISNV